MYRAKNTNMSSFQKRLELTHTKQLKQFVLLKMLHLWKKTFTKKLNYGGIQPKRKCSSVEEKKK